MLRGILKAPRMTNHELGCLPIRYIVKSKRLNFLHYILNQEEDSQLKTFLNAQNEKSSKTDWTEKMKRDLKEVEIHMSFEEIKEMKETRFKKHIKIQIIKGALKYLKFQIKSKGK